MTQETLYTTKDIQRVREKLFTRQGKQCDLIQQEIDIKQAVLDHSHETQYVRAVLHRQSNAVLGKIENLYTRYLKWWYNGTLVDFLKKTAEYLEKTHPEEYVHTGWMKKVKTEFNKLNSKEQDEVICRLGGEESPNGTTRKKQFQNLILNREYSFKEIKEYLKQAKE